MNWLKKIAQKPMALPVYPPRSDSEYWNHGEGTTRIDAIMEEETARREKNQYPDMQWLGAGAFGVAVENTPNEVIKYTKDEMEVQRASWAFKNKPAWVVTFLDMPRQVQEYPPLWALKMKKLEILNREEQQYVTSIIVVAEDNFGTLPDFEESLQTTSLDGEIAEDLYSQIDYILRENMETLQLDDLHGGNVGRDQRNLKVFDLGSGDDSYFS